MYLPAELDPVNTPRFAVIVLVRATGARRIEHIVDWAEEAERLAEICRGYVVNLTLGADYR